MPSVKTQSSDAICWSNILTAIEVQSRVVYAVILRETKSRYGEHKLGFLWVLIEPALFIAMFTAFRTLLGARAINGMEPELFMLTGLAPFLLFRGTMSQASAAITSNKSLLAFPQVTTFDLLIARSLLEFAAIASVFFILIVILMGFGIEVRIQYPMQLFGVFVLFFISGIGIGAAVGCLAPFFPSIKEISAQLFGRPLLITSGIFYSADQLPRSVREYMLYNPFLQMTELARSAFFVSFESNYVELDYIIKFSLLLLVFGLLMHQALHKKVLGT